MPYFLSKNANMPINAEILEKLRHNDPTLMRLNLNASQISDEGVKALAVVLQHNTTVTRLDLWSNHIGADGVKVLAEALHYNTTVTQLNLEFNSIGVIGAKALAEALHHNTALTQLNLWSNHIGSAGAKALAEALHHNTTLTQLNLEFNNIGATGIIALAEALEYNTTLTELSLEGNPTVEDAGRKRIVSLLTANQAIAAEKNPVERAKRVGRKTGHYPVPSLLELGFFNVKQIVAKNTLTTAEIKAWNLPEELYKQLVS